jgi:hypothetical protein
MLVDRNSWCEDSVLALRASEPDRSLQQAVRAWGEVFRDDVVAAAMIDRLVHAQRS